MAVPISITGCQLPLETHKLYDVAFSTRHIVTFVTHTSSQVDSWLAQIRIQALAQQTHPTIVGLDVEWCPNFSPQSDNPIATLQLVTFDRCLVFQILHSAEAPNTLAQFLLSKDFVFVGVGIHQDVEKLVRQYGLSVRNAVDLRWIAADRMGPGELRNAGLKELVRRVLGVEVDRPKVVRLSKWDDRWLSPAQVQYACVGAFLSFEIGRVLNVAAGV